MKKEGFKNPQRCNFFNWYSGGWSPIGSTRHYGHQKAYCASPGWLRWWRNWWNDDWQGKPKYSEETCPRAALSTTNPTCCPDANPGRRGGKPATNRLSYGTVSQCCNHFLSLSKKATKCVEIHFNLKYRCALGLRSWDDSLTRHVDREAFSNSH
jgi:hypothetical protein